MNSNEMTWIDLPSLQSIHLGWWTLRGKRDDDSSSLTMRSNNEMIWNDWMQIFLIYHPLILMDIVSIILVQWQWKVFLNLEYWWYLDIPNLQNVNLPDSFLDVQSKSISSIDWLFGMISFIDISPILAEIFTIKLPEVVETKSCCIILWNAIDRVFIIEFIHFIELDSLIIIKSIFALFLRSKPFSIIPWSLICHPIFYSLFPSYQFRLD